MSTNETPKETPKETTKPPVPTPSAQIQPPPPVTTSLPPFVPPTTTSAPPPSSIEQQLALAKQKAQQINERLSQPQSTGTSEKEPARRSSTSSHHSTHSNRSGDEGDYTGRKSRTTTSSGDKDKYYSGDKYEKSKDGYGSRPSSSHSRRSDYDRPRSRDQGRRRSRSRSRDRGEKQRQRSRTPPSPKKKASDSSLKRERETSTLDDVPRPAPVPIPKPATTWQLGEDGLDWAPGKEKAIPGKKWKLIEPDWSLMSRDHGYLTTNKDTQQIERELAVEKVKEHVNSLVADGTVPGELVINVIINDHGYHLNLHGTAETVYHWTLTFASSTKKRLTYTGTKPSLNILHVRMPKAAYWERLTTDLRAKKDGGWIDQTAFANASAHLKSLPK